MSSYPSICQVVHHPCVQDNSFSITQFIHRIFSGYYNKISEEFLDQQPWPTSVTWWPFLSITLVYKITLFYATRDCQKFNDCVLWWSFEQVLNFVTLTYTHWTRKLSPLLFSPVDLIVNGSCKNCFVGSLSKIFHPNMMLIYYSWHKITSI